ncbi:GGDEF domain-containing protein [Lachnoclostridium phytofermentans]|uniref:Diguanylate cyclase n=1 Tax=Lachnoclostridium phytofermentans (strain ATCC 700394 / DSM 18823 / ISDg) TaxID=357809 RepID=A9KI89_LACP7|nr:GGDEF domain-containing protein [Lachnoclostridium phytofermentans]ABX40923.1 diguanylate cyclase [Lachnoclostridium phytofermentans ISDg]
MEDNKILTRAYVGCATFDSDFRIRVGDEGIYRIIDEGKCYPYSLLLLIHNEEQEDFCIAVQNLKENEVHSGTFHIRLEDGKFYVVYYVVENQGIQYMDEELYQIRLYNIKAFHQVITKQENEIMDYRTILSLTNNLYFSYDMNTTNFTYYWMSGNQEVIVAQQPLLLWKKEVLDNGYVKEQEKAIFGSMCEDLMAGTSNFYYQLINSILTNGKEVVRWVIRGCAVHERMKLDRIVGVIEIEKLTKDVQENFFYDLMNRDALTGLLNKRAITQLAEQKIQYTGKDKFRFLILDVDNFKTINDSYGHMVGDEAIVRVANIVKKMVGDHGVVGRIGGDELFAILDNVDDEKSLRNVLKAIRENVAYAYVGSENNIHITCSMGCAEYPTDGVSYKELFQKADYSLYLAKEKGKNRYIIYNPLKHGEVSCKFPNAILGMEIAFAGCSNTNLFSNMMQSLYEMRKDGIEEVFCQLGELYQFEKINVYYGRELPLIIQWGKINSEDKNAKYLLEQGYQKNFSANGVIVLENMNISKSLQAYQIFMKQNLTFVMQIMIKKENNILGLISLERKVKKSKMSVVDINNLELLCRLIGNIVLDTTPDRNVILDTI